MVARIARLPAQVAYAINDVAEDLVHVGHLLRRDLHLMLLLVYGVGALASGLVIGVNFSIPAAICSSTFAYLLVTFAVLRAAEAARGNNGYNQEDEDPKICLEDINRMMDIPVEKFVADEDLDGCSVQQLRSMLALNRPRCEKDEEWTRVMRDPNVDPAEILGIVRKCKSAQSDTCAICFEDYHTGDVLKTLPRCSHRFHPQCIESWAHTFATRGGCPTCPLCNDKMKVKAA